MYNLFLTKDKQEKIDEMTRILKHFQGHGNKIPTRDYYNRLNTYRGTKTDDMGRVIPLQEQPFVPNLRIGDNGDIELDGDIQIRQIDGPMHNTRPRGPALKLEEPGHFVASITYSKVNIKDTNYSWWRIERNRAWMGYVSWGDMTNENYGTKYTMDNL